MLSLKDFNYSKSIGQYGLLYCHDKIDALNLEIYPITKSITSHYVM